MFPVPRDGVSCVLLGPFHSRPWQGVDGDPCGEAMLFGTWSLLVASRPWQGIASHCVAVHFGHVVQLSCGPVGRSLVRMGQSCGPVGQYIVVPVGPPSTGPVSNCLATVSASSRASVGSGVGAI